VPLVIATGASKLAFRDVATPVFGGMLAASLRVFAIPPLYVLFQSIRERIKASLGSKAGSRAAARDPLPKNDL